jgi:hypothetical protein
MKFDLSNDDLSLCIAALGHAAGDLREGITASHRLGTVPQDYLVELEKKAAAMDGLKERLLGVGKGEQ